MKRIVLLTLMAMPFVCQARMGGVVHRRDVKVTVMNDSNRKLDVDTPSQKPFTVRPHGKRTFTQGTMSGRGIGISFTFTVDKATTTYTASVGKDQEEVTVKVKYNEKKNTLKASTETKEASKI